jgi:hypothetical protein
MKKTIGSNPFANRSNGIKGTNGINGSGHFIRDEAVRLTYYTG